jgi:hypothetical protein
LRPHLRLSSLPSDDYWMNWSLPTKPILVTPSRCAEAMTPATNLSATSLLGRRWTAAGFQYNLTLVFCIVAPIY